jgi:hypothetical protein
MVEGFTVELLGVLAPNNLNTLVHDLAINTLDLAAKPTGPPTPSGSTGKHNL